MMRSLRLALALCAALTGACGSDPGLGPDSRGTAPTRVLTRLEVAPTNGVLKLGHGQQLTITASDQFGVKMLNGSDSQWTDAVTFVSSAREIAEVGSHGLVTAGAPGTAKITASLTLAGVTVTGWTTVNVDPPTDTSVVVSSGQDGTEWSPATVYLKAGGTVTWVIPAGGQPKTIWLDVWERNATELKFVDGVATHTFSTPGSYYYGTRRGLYWWEEGGLVKVF